MRSFLSYIEIKTKITSFFTFIYMIAYLLYNNQEINLQRTIIFFLSMFLFDLTTTAINNYIDTKTNGQELQVSRHRGLLIIYILFIISTGLGLYLVFITDIVMLFVGGLCFICGVMYTYGPIPISRLPLGEIVSGIFYGLFIPFILLYINLPETSILSLVVEKNIIELKINILWVFKLILLSVIPIITTANIMLANNICDLEKDIEVKRYTLPYYLGKKMSLLLFAGLYYVIYIDIILMVLFKILSPLSLLFILTIIPVQRNIRKFYDKQNKSLTFICSINNFVIIMGVITILIFISSLEL